MTDYIDRQAAIDALDGEITVTGKANAEAVRGYVNLVADRIKRLPSAEIELVKRGRWIAIGNTGLAQCKCGYMTDRYCIYNYCPNCGAKMEVSDNG